MTINNKGIILNICFAYNSDYELDQAFSNCKNQK